jgi:hypothetical protein
MKKLLVALALSLAVFLPRAQAIPDSLPFLGSLRFQVNNQLTLASNNLSAAVAVTNKVEAAKQKKLITLLNTARKTIDKTKTNYVAGATVLGALNKTLGRSALSNEFNPILTNTFNVYLAALINLEDAYSDRVDGSYPGRAHDAAAKALDKFLLALNSASTNTNYLLRLKFLLAAAKGEALSLKATVKAEHAPLPPAQYKATITGALFGNFNFTPKPANAIAAVFNAPFNSLTMNGVNGTTSGSGFGTKLTTRQLLITIPNLTDGTTTYQVGDGSGKVFILYTVGRGGIGGSDGADGYEAVSGSLTVTVNKASKTAVGTYSFYAPGENTATAASTSNGSFSIVWIE